MLRLPSRHLLLATRHSQASLGGALTAGVSAALSLLGVFLVGPFLRGLFLLDLSGRPGMQTFHKHGDRNECGLREFPVLGSLSAG